MKIVIAVLALTPMLAHAVTYDNAYYPPPNPPCVVDDCIPKNPKPRPLPCPKPYIRPWDDCGRTTYDALGDLRTKTSGLSAAIADGKMDKAGESLNGLFAGTGSREKGSETSAVAAGGWTVEPRTDAGLLNFQPSPSESGKLPLIERDFKIVPVGLKEEAAKEIIKEVVKEAIPVVKEVVKKADQALSDRLTAPDTERARQEYGGCRMKGTCPK